MRLGSSFTDDGRLLTGFTSGVVAWNVETGEYELLVETPLRQFVASADGRRLLVMEGQGLGVNQNPAGPPTLFDLDSGEARELSTHTEKVQAMAVNSDATIVATGDSDGIIRVGPVTGEEPHLLLGHDGEIFCLAIDPRGRWIASGGMDETVRLWPMPDLSKPPLHTLPREELIAKLKTLTNLRVVRDPESATGWKLTHDPFPGWETVPTW
jgi:WD40 repeat protein